MAALIFIAGLMVSTPGALRIPAAGLYYGARAGHQPVGVAGSPCCAAALKPYSLGPAQALALAMPWPRWAWWLVRRAAPEKAAAAAAMAAVSGVRRFPGGPVTGVPRGLPGLRWRATLGCLVRATSATCDLVVALLRVQGAGRAITWFYALLGAARWCCRRASGQACWTAAGGRRWPG